MGTQTEMTIKDTRGTSSRRARELPRRRTRRQILAGLLLDALRGAKTYVMHYSAGRGAE